MKLYEMVFEEFIKIVERLLQDLPVENNRIVVERERFKQFLNKFAYLPFQRKTKIYKSLSLIIHDKDNYTLPCKDPDTKKVVRKVVINYEAYTIIRYLFETELKT